MGAFSVGALAPVGEVADIANLGFVMGFAGGYHVHRLLRVDGALDVGFSRSSTSNTIQTSVGDREVRLGRQFLVRVGPSLVVSTGTRFLVSIGGGFSYVWYRETLEQAALNETVAGWSSESRRGPGHYLGLMLERTDSVGGRLVGYGLSVTFYNMSSDGESLHGLFDGDTRDRWIALGLTLAWHS